MLPLAGLGIVAAVSTETGFQFYAFYSRLTLIRINPDTVPQFAGRAAFLRLRAKLPYGLSGTSSWNCRAFWNPIDPANVALPIGQLGAAVRREDSGDQNVGGVRHCILVFDSHQGG